MSEVRTPWINGIPKAARYAHMRESEMRRLVKKGEILSRKKPADERGHRARGLLVYAPSIDAYLMSQEPGANPIAVALATVA